MRFEILGPIQVHGAHGRVAVKGHQRVLLGMLLLHANEVVTVERLIEAIWADRPPRDARNQVHGCVYRLRRRLANAGLPEQIVTDEAGYELRVDADSVDLSRFRRLVTDARSAAKQDRLHDAVDGYLAALRLWRGPAMAGVDSPLVRNAAAILDEEHVQAAEECIGIELELGRAGELVAKLTDLVSRYPYRETLHGTLMLALYRAGRPADALAAYQRARRVLVDEVGTEPGTELRDLHHRILQDDVTLVRHATPQASNGGSAAPGRHCLPRAVDDFTGRPDAVARLVDAATNGGDSTVLAIDGMAGVGKTTLAVHVAHQLAEHYPEAQLFIDLHGHSERRPTEPAAALDALLRQLDIPGGRIPPELEGRVSLWRSELAERRALVVLDNAASTAQVMSLLPGGQDCLVLVTSRRRLSGLDATRPLSLDVLTTDEAVALLAQAAGDRVREEPEAAAEVARRCGYLPLALRLAAARLAHRPGWRVQDLADRLRDAGGMLTELVAEDRTVVDAFALSYAQLAAEEQRVFRLLGLHPGQDFDAYAVAALADSALAEAERVLDDLVDRHLVEEPRPGRYRFHDLVREYASQLGSMTDAETIRREAMERLLNLHMHAALRASSSLDAGTGGGRRTDPGDPTRPDLVAGLAARGTAWLEVERPGLVAAIRAATTFELDQYAWQLALAGWSFLYRRGYTDDLRATHRVGLAAAERLGADNAIATMCNYLASAHYRIGEFEQAADLLRRALVLRQQSGDRKGAAATRSNLALVQRRLGHMDEAEVSGRHALAAYQRVGNLGGMGMALQNLGLLYTELGRYGEAARCHRRRLSISRQVGDVPGCANPLSGLGAIRTKLGEYSVGRRLLLASLRLQRTIGNRDGEYTVDNDLGALYRALRDFDHAIPRHRQALAIAQDAGDKAGECMVRNDLGRTLREGGEVSAALAEHRAVLTEATRIKLKLEQARALDGIAACLRDTEPQEARRHWQRALVLYREMGVPERAEVEHQLAGLVWDRIDNRLGCH